MTTPEARPAAIQPARVRPLRWLLTWRIILVAAVPLLLLSLYFGLVLARNQREEAGAHLSTLARAFAREISDHLGTHLQVITLL